MTGVSIAPTPWRIQCPAHGGVYLTRLEADRQRLEKGRFHSCPRCGSPAYEAAPAPEPLPSPA